MIQSGYKSNQKASYLVPNGSFWKSCGISSTSILVDGTITDPMEYIVYNEIRKKYFLLGAKGLYCSEDGLNWFLVIATTHPMIQICFDDKGNIYTCDAQHHFYYCVTDDLNFVLNTQFQVSSFATRGDRTIFGSFQKIYYNDSSNPTNFNLTHNFDLYDYFKVWYKGGVFFSNDGTESRRRPLYRSTDGINWVNDINWSATNITNYNFSINAKIEYFNEKWYFHGGGGTLLKSVDSINWTATSISNVRDILSGGNNFFIVNSSGAILNLNNDVVASTSNYRNFNRSLFYDKATDFWSAEGVFSADGGKTWESFKDTPSPTFLLRRRNIDFIFSVETKNFIAALMENHAPRPLIQNINLDDLVYGNEIWVGIKNNIVFYSVDGIVWEKSSINLTQEIKGLSFIRENFYIKVGEDWYYSKGKEWTQCSQENFPILYEITEKNIYKMIEHQNFLIFIGTDGIYQYPLSLMFKNINIGPYILIGDGDSSNLNTNFVINEDKTFIIGGVSTGGVRLEPLADFWLSTSKQESLTYDTNSIVKRVFLSKDKALWLRSDNVLTYTSVSPVGTQYYYGSYNVDKDFLFIIDDGEYMIAGVKQEEKESYEIYYTKSDEFNFYKDDSLTSLDIVSLQYLNGCYFGITKKSIIYFFKPQEKIYTTNVNHSPTDINKINKIAQNEDILIANINGQLLYSKTTPN